jgi:hypothetical protein
MRWATSRSKPTTKIFPSGVGRKGITPIKLYHINITSMFKIEVFSALQTRFGPLQNIPLSQQLFETKPQIENQDVTWDSQYNPPATRTNKRRALSQKEVKVDGRFLLLHIVLETCIIYFMHKSNMSFVFQFCILGLTSWIWTSPSIKELKFESPWEPFKMKLLWGLQSWTLIMTMIFSALENINYTPSLNYTPYSLTLGLFYWKHVSYTSCTSLIWVSYFISVFLDWRLGFEPDIQIKGWNLIALQNETPIRASILNTDHHDLRCIRKY